MTDTASKASKKRMRVRVPAAPLHKLLGIDERPAKPTYSLGEASRMLGMTSNWGYGAVAKGIFPVPVIPVSSGRDTAA